MLQAVSSAALWSITIQDIQTSPEATPQVPLLMMMTWISQVTILLLMMTPTTNTLEWFEPDLLLVAAPTLRPLWMDNYRQFVLEFQTNFISWTT